MVKKIVFLLAISGVDATAKAAFMDPRAYAEGLVAQELEQLKQQGVDVEALQQKVEAEAKQKQQQKQEQKQEHARCPYCGEIDCPFERERQRARRLGY